MQNYDIRYDDKYGQLAQIDVAAEGAGYEPWVNQTLTSVNDSVVRLAVIEGELVDWHSHEHEDEFFLVVEGKLELEVEGREPFVLGVHQGVTIPRGVLHHPRAHGRTVLLMVEPATVIPTGNDWPGPLEGRSLERRTPPTSRFSSAASNRGDAYREPLGLAAWCGGGQK